MLIPTSVFVAMLAIIGYVWSGWKLAVTLSVLFVVAIPPLNHLVIWKAPDSANLIVVFQAAKWVVFSTLLAGAFVVRTLFA